MSFATTVQAHNPHYNMQNCSLIGEDGLCCHVGQWHIIVVLPGRVTSVCIHPVQQQAQHCCKCVHHIIRCADPSLHTSETSGWRERIWYSLSKRSQAMSVEEVTAVLIDVACEVFEELKQRVDSSHAHAYVSVFADPVHLDERAWFIVQQAIVDARQALVSAGESQTALYPLLMDAVSEAAFRNFSLQLDPAQSDTDTWRDSHLQARSGTCLQVALLFVALQQVLECKTLPNVAAPGWTAESTDLFEPGMLHCTCPPTDS